MMKWEDWNNKFKWEIRKYKIKDKKDKIKWMLIRMILKVCWFKIRTW